MVVGNSAGHGGKAFEGVSAHLKGKERPEPTPLLPLGWPLVFLRRHTTDPFTRLGEVNNAAAVAPENTESLHSNSSFSLVALPTVE